MKNVQVSLDDLLADLDAAWADAMKLSKSEERLSKDEDEDQAPGPDDQAPAQPQPPAQPQAQAPSAPEAPAGDQGMEGSDADQEADEGTADEGMESPDHEGAESPEQEQMEDEHLSDEDLQHVYSSMEPAELERHYMIIRGILQQQYAKAEKAEAAEKAVAKKAKPEAEKEEMDKCGEMAPPVKKSEGSIVDAKIEELEKSNKELQAGLEKALQAVKLLAQPTRKAVTSEIQYIAKSEAPKAPEVPAINYEAMSKPELTHKLNEVCQSGKLNKAERDIINSFVLHNTNKEQIIEILRSKK